MDAEKQLSLVTGASSGIGAEFARLLAEQGSDLILTARRRDRLEALATELTDRHAIDVTVVENDLDTPDGPRRLFDEVMQRSRPVTTLVNNAGFGIYGCVVQQDPMAIESMVRVNVIALTALTRLFAAEMEAAGGGRDPQRRLIRRRAADSALRRLFRCQGLCGGLFSGIAA